MAIIHVENAYYTREKQMILSDISFSVEKGQHQAIIGLNGSGKTTLLQLIHGSIWPLLRYDPVVEVLGQRLGKTDLNELRKSIGWVSNAFTERISPMQEVTDVVISGKFASAGLYEQVTEEDESQAMKMMQEWGIAHLRGKPFRICSQGERQKILIARALMASPQLLILDEPCNGLDLYSREQLLAQVERLGKEEEGPTILYITHHIEEVCPVFTHAMIMENGRIAVNGKKKDVLTADHLSKSMGVPLEVTWNRELPWVQVISNEVKSASPSA
ncbi:ABC transporter ATP-binding protein [Guptibacillus hwajinpoensis]|uniref:ABC transporter ATP-binding protein n=1 Tax=Guptibacillus hwajinpoensis TaxID=208199 RepID=UPI00273D7D6A|nr:ATP-binding cassette domain-containing protein [Pseudalkalibacillus hwajinpoensis]WLR59265.1 ATP-binding cassette domain-containing protein [Pseudalkalibacillus hwajinpoensis]